MTKMGVTKMGRSEAGRSEAGHSENRHNQDMQNDKSAADLAAAIDRTARISGTFALRSGATSDTYFDKYLFEADPQLLHRICQQLAVIVPAGTDVLAGMEMGGIPLVTVLGQITGLPTAFIRKEAKTYGTCKYAEGANLEGRRVVLVEDVVSSGGALVSRIEALNRDGIGVKTAICVIDRESGGKEALAGLGVELRSLFTLDQIEAAGS